MPQHRTDFIADPPARPALTPTPSQGFLIGTNAIPDDELHRLEDKPSEARFEQPPLSSSTTVGDSMKHLFRHTKEGIVFKDPVLTLLRTLAASHNSPWYTIKEVKRNSSILIIHQSTISKERVPVARNAVKLLWMVITEKDPPARFDSDDIIMKDVSWAFTVALCRAAHLVAKSNRADTVVDFGPAIVVFEESTDIYSRSCFFCAGSKTAPSQTFLKAELAAKLHFRRQHLRQFPDRPWVRCGSKIYASRETTFIEYFTHLQMTALSCVMMRTKLKLNYVDLAWRPQGLRTVAQKRLSASLEGFQMSVSEPLELRPRKRMRTRRRGLSEDEHEFSKDYRQSITQAEGMRPVTDQREPNEEYDVEAIRDIRNQNGTLSVLVKWKNWPESTNSWESFSNIRCYDAITEFLVMRDDTKYMPVVIKDYVLEKFRYPDANIFIVCKLFETGYDLKQCLLLDYREKLRLIELLRLTTRKSLLRRIRKHYGSPLEFVRHVDVQQKLRSALEELQRQFTSELRQEAPFYFENLIDCESTPVSFTIIEDYSFAAGISPRVKEGSCKCLDCETCTCTESFMGGARSVRNYHLDGRLVDPIRAREGALFECGSHCCCAVDCYNRVTQRGRPVEVTVYKTGTEKGWGLRTNSSIRAWTFVMEYLGVVKRYFCVPSEDVFPYVFELKVDGQQRPSYVVDSSQCGNISRFINHSCNPNLIPVRVFNQHSDPEIPRIAFFACRDILENEELTFDYRTMKVARSSRSQGFCFECCCQETNCCRELSI